MEYLFDTSFKGSLKEYRRGFINTKTQYAVCHGDLLLPLTHDLIAKKAGLQ